MRERSGERPEMLGLIQDKESHKELLIQKIEKLKQQQAKNRECMESVCVHTHTKHFCMLHSLISVSYYSQCFCIYLFSLKLSDSLTKPSQQGPTKEFEQN